MRNCCSLNIPLIAGNSEMTISSEALPKGGERSTTIPKGSRGKCLETGDINSRKFTVDEDIV